MNIRHNDENTPRLNRIGGITVLNAKHITDLTLENFRGFSKLELHGFQAVNLIVGQNNVGKTSLLEGIVLASDATSFQRIAGLLHGHATVSEHGEEIHNDPRFERWLIKDAEESLTASIDASGTTFSSSLVLKRVTNSYQPSQEEWPLTIHQSDRLHVVQKNERQSLRVRIVSVLPFSAQSIVATVGNALRKRQGEDLIHKVLQKIDPRIQRIRVDPVKEGNIVAVDIGLSEMIPITQAGQGAVRLVSMLAELIGENAQICIIDEIENGIHHTALKDVWRGVAEISAAMGVQVFATTHSQECLAAANEVFFSDDSTQKKDFALIQLMRVKDQVTGKVLSEARVNDALDNEIELR